MRSRSLLPVILILLFSLGNSSCNWNIEPRANAIGLRLGSAYTVASFVNDNITSTDQSGTPSTSRQTVIENNDTVNSSSVLRQPLTIQLEETSAAYGLHSIFSIYQELLLMIYHQS